MPLPAADTDSNTFVEQLRKRMADTGSLSIYKVTSTRYTAGQGHPPQDRSVNMNAGQSGKPAPEHPQAMRAEEASRQEREGHTVSGTEIRMSLSVGEAAQPTEQGCFRELSNIGLNTPTTTHERLVGPSTTYLVSSKIQQATVKQRNMAQGGPMLSRVLGSQHSPYSVPGSRGKAPYSAPNQNCHQKIAQGANRFQQPSSVPQMDKGSQAQPARGRQGWREEPGQSSSKQTKITILLPELPNKEESQLITIFLELSKLHGCNFSVDMMGCRVSVDKTNPPPASQCPAASLQTPPNAGVGQRLLGHTVGGEQSPAPSRNFTIFQYLKSRLEAMGTHLEPIVNFQESPGGSSDSSESLPLFPEVVMGTPPT